MHDLHLPRRYTAHGKPAVIIEPMTCVDEPDAITAAKEHTAQRVLDEAGKWVTSEVRHLVYLGYTRCLNEFGVLFPPDPERGDAYRHGREAMLGFLDAHPNRCALVIAAVEARRPDAFGSGLQP